MADKQEDEEFTAREIADEITSEENPRGDEETSNGEKWSLANKLIIPQKDFEKGMMVNVLADHSKHYIQAYESYTDDLLMAWMLVADVQNDVFETILFMDALDEHTAEEAELIEVTSLVLYRKLADKYIATENGTEVKHVWLN